MKPPKISVVLTTYNRAHLLGRTIECIQAQTVGDFELIICDDVSEDHTESVCRAYQKLDPRIRYLKGARNAGMPGNLNAGIRACSAEYVANLHDGDLYEPTLLERWAEALDQFPNAAFVFNAYRDIDSAGQTKQVCKEPLGPCQPGSVVLERLFFRRWLLNSPVWGTVMARRSAYLAANLFDPRFGFIADVDMWLRLAEQFDIAYVPEPLIIRASREAVPRIWNGAERLTQRYVRRMFWESRLRHYKGSPVRLLAEVVRHGAFVAASEGWRAACSANRIRRSLWNSVSKSSLKQTVQTK